MMSRCLDRFQACNRRLKEQAHVHVTPKRARFSENFPNTNCRAIGDLQLCLNEFGLIRAGLQVTMLQSGAH